VSVQTPPEGPGDLLGLLRLDTGGSAAVPDPFPGLRAFAEAEASFFFGREGIADALVARMEQTRFVAVVGTSGSGKSSLVRAGLFPFLRGGYLDGATQRWSIVDLRPGFDPIGNLVTALKSLPTLFGDLTTDELLSNSLALVDRVRSRHGSDAGNLLILVDQFEELFRYGEWTEGAAREGRVAFVRALLEVAQMSSLNVFVVATMRSDFIGDCARVRGLAEAVSKGQYLIPRLTRAGWRAAIEGPINVVGARITNRLVQRLLNETGDDPDQLPVLQHALLRTWEEWKSDKAEGYVGPLDEQHYERTGMLAEALSRHATTTYDLAIERASELRQRGPNAALPERTIKLIFQRLRAQDDKGRETRRPCTIGELQKVTEAELSDLLSYLSCFTEPGRTFLVTSKPLPSNVALPTDEVLTIAVDLTHECLLRKWDLLVKWCQEERDSQRIYMRLLQALEETKGDSPPMADQLLDRTLSWWLEKKPNAAWATRYDGHLSTAEGSSNASLFEAARAFLFSSKAARDDRDVKETVKRMLAMREEIEGELTIKRLRRTRVALLIVLSLLGSAVVGVARSVVLSARLKREQDSLKTANTRAQFNWREMLREVLITRAEERSSDPKTVDEALMLATSSLKIEGSVRAYSRLSELLTLFPTREKVIAPQAPALIAAARGAPIVVVMDGRTAVFRDALSQGKIASVTRKGTPIAIDLDRGGNRLAILTEDGLASVYDRTKDAVVHTFQCKEPDWISMDGVGHKVLATCEGRAVLWKETGDKWSLAKVPGPRLKEKVHGCELSDKGNEFSYLIDDDTDDESRTYFVKSIRDGMVLESISGIGAKMDGEPYRWETNRLDLRTLVAVANDGSRVDVYAEKEADKGKATDTSARRIDYSAGKEPTFSIAHSGHVMSLNVSADGRILFTADKTGVIRGFRFSDSHEVFRAERAPFDEHSNLAISSDERAIWVADSSGLAILTPDESLPISTLKGSILSDGGHLYEPQSVVTLADGKRVRFPDSCRILVGLNVTEDMSRIISVCVSDSITWQFVLKVYEGDAVISTQAIEGSVWNAGCNISPKGTYVAEWYPQRKGSGSDGKPSRDKSPMCVRVDKIGASQRGPEDCSYPNGRLFGTFEPDGSAFWVTSGDATPFIQRTAISSGNPTPRIKLDPDEVTGTIAAASGGRYVLLGLKREALKVEVVEIARDEIVRRLAVPTGSGIVDAVFSADGRHFATAGDDLTVRVWEIASDGVKEVVRFAARARTVAFSPDNSRLVFDDGQDWPRRPISRIWRGNDLMSRAKDVLADTCKRIGRDVEKEIWTSAVGQEAGFEEFRSCPQ
jgi:WD40 repeat protein